MAPTSSSESELSTDLEDYMPLQAPSGAEVGRRPPQMRAWQGRKCIEECTHIYIYICQHAIGHCCAKLHKSESGAWGGPPGTQWATAAAAGPWEGGAPESPHQKESNKSQNYIHISKIYTNSRPTGPQPYSSPLVMFIVLPNVANRNGFRVDKFAFYICLKRVTTHKYS